MRKLIIFVLLITFAALLYPAPTASIASTFEWTCPTALNTYSASVFLLHENGRNYLIDPLEQGFAATADNVDNLQYVKSPQRWLVNGLEVAPSWDFVYRIDYMGPGPWGNFQPMGEAWIGKLREYNDVYFTFVMPVMVSGVHDVLRNGKTVTEYIVEYTDHPNCGYGSGRRASIDALLKPRP
ncbi:MAG: hypothetical protein KF716_08750 [Anaerolineae bacterium]|nr:hypothetical protein [Anaerolineae bacterium]